MERNTTMTTVQDESFFVQSALHTSTDHRLLKNRHIINLTNDEGETDHRLPKKRHVIDLTNDEEDIHAANSYPREKRRRHTATVETISKTKKKKKPESPFKVSFENVHHCACGKILNDGPKSRLGGRVST
jgi:hypothetical protein